MAKSKQILKHLDLDESRTHPHKVVNTRFDHCAAGMIGRRPSSRLRINHLTVRDCNADHCFVGPIIFDSCEFHNIRAKPSLWLEGSAFIRCKVSGFLQGIIAFALTDPVAPLTDEINTGIYNDNQRIYSEIDWALDLTEADCHDVQIRGIPVHLIKVRGTDQVKVSYEKACVVRDSLPEESFMNRLLESRLCGHRSTESNFVVVTHPGSKLYDNTMLMIEVLAEHGALIEGD